jgi:hypothetical protein
MRPFKANKSMAFMFIVFAVPSFQLFAQNEVAETVQSFIASSTPMAIAYIISITAMKICAFVIGYFIVKLGHDTLIKGVSGDIDFGFTGGGVETKLKSASPGAFFVLAGSAIIMWGLFVEKPISLSLGPSTANEVQQSTNDMDKDDKTNNLKRREPIE